MKFDDFLDSISGMSPEEQIELLLRYLTAEMATMDRGTVIGLRDYFRSMPEDNDQRTAVLEVIEGHLALREIERQS